MPVDPLLQRVEAQPKSGSYAVTFVMPDGQERSVVMRVTGAEVDIPAANLLEGWPATSASFQAALAVVSAVHAARELAGAGRNLLLDLDGGWDVSIGNVVLSAAGEPECVAHGAMEQTRPSVWTCPECGATGLYGSDAG